LRPCARLVPPNQQLHKYFALFSPSATLKVDPIKVLTRIFGSVLVDVEEYARILCDDPATGLFSQFY
jgi:hypothetical protein